MASSRNAIRKQMYGRVVYHIDPSQVVVVVVVVAVVVVVVVARMRMWTGIIKTTKRVMLG